jgi:hypothetical protein
MHLAWESLFCTQEIPLSWIPPWKVAHTLCISRCYTLECLHMTLKSSNTSTPWSCYGSLKGQYFRGISAGSPAFSLTKSISVSLWICCKTSITYVYIYTSTCMTFENMNISNLIIIILYGATTSYLFLFLCVLASISNNSNKYLHIC